MSGFLHPGKEEQVQKDQKMRNYAAGILRTYDVNIWESGGGKWSAEKEYFAKNVILKL